MKTLKWSNLVFVAAALLLPVFAAAQGVTTAAFNGIITGDEGEPLPGAAISALHLPTSTLSTAVSRVNGQYNIPAVRVGGPYRIKVELPGFKTEERDDIYVKLGEDHTIDFTMAQATIDAGEIIVTAEADPIINPSRTGVTQNVSYEEITRLPSINQDLSDFVRLSPQIQSNPESSGSFSVAGKNNRYNNIQIDGAVNNDLFGLAGTGTPGGQSDVNIISLDAIQEFQIVVSPYSVRHGGFTGGGINAITRSGRNEFFGNAYFFGQNQDFIGDGPFESDYPEFNEGRYGLSIGGPVVKDKAFFFINGELKRRNAPDQWFLDDSGNLNDWGGDAISTADADRFINILQNKYGYQNPGDYNQFTKDTDSEKIFARFDFNLSEAHRLTLRHNYVKGLNDRFFSRDWNSFGLPDTNYLMRNTTHSTVLQLNSAMNNNMHNELILNYTTIRDRRAGEFDPFPQVTIRVNGPYEFRAGTEQYSTQNELDQDIIAITDNLTIFAGDHQFVLGTHNEFFKFRNLFIPANFGVYSFDSLDDFEAGDPAFYKYVYSNTDDPREASRFWVYQFGLYAGDQWSVLPNLNLTFGARLTVPIIPQKPTANPEVEQIYGIATDHSPSGNILFSPRAGFNWDVNADNTTQIRGGIGLFSGRTPYVWISNQFSNTGIEFTRIEARGDNAPQFVADPYNQPISGFTGATNEINLISEDYKYPQILRTSLGIDQKLPLGFTGTAEFIYSRTVNDILYENLNIVPTGETLSDGRPLYGEPDLYGNPNYKNPDYSYVIHLTNTGKGYQYMLSFQLRRQSKHFNFNASYTYGMAKDKNSGTSSQAKSNWRYNPTQGNPDDPPLAFSTFDLRHKINVAATFNFELIKRATSSLSLIYSGFSGYPFSFIYYGDANGDGQRNDLVYVPETENDIILTSNNWAELDAYINDHPGLNDYRGEIVDRNASRDPWKHRVDLRFSQDIPFPGLSRGAIQMVLNIMNFTNLLNKEWGQYEYIKYDASPMTFLGVDEATGKQIISFSSKYGQYTINDYLSRWQMQLGARIRF